jgi:hypothetical protein
MTVAPTFDRVQREAANSLESVVPEIGQYARLAAATTLYHQRCGRRAATFHAGDHPHPWWPADKSRGQPSGGEFGDLGTVAGLPSTSSAFLHAVFGRAARASGTGWRPSTPTAVLQPEAIDMPEECLHTRAGVAADQHP